ncbi:MAG: IS607 family transposase [Candidatus Helarchaeota archaeon]
MSSYLRVAEAARLLGICAKTLHRWNTRGKIRCFRTLGGHRRIPLSEIKRIQSGTPPSPLPLSSGVRTALYCRVFSYDQKKSGVLERQREQQVT